MTSAIATLLGVLSLTVLHARANAQTTPRLMQAEALIQTAADLEQCDQQPFSMMDDIRFGMFVVSASGYETTLAETAETLQAARRTQGADCTNDLLQKRIEAFASDVLPQIRRQR